jgi:hypothetical protein
MFLKATLSKLAWNAPKPATVRDEEALCSLFRLHRPSTGRLCGTPFCFSGGPVKQSDFCFGGRARFSTGPHARSRKVQGEPPRSACLGQNRSFIHLPGTIVLSCTPRVPVVPSVGVKVCLSGPSPHRAGFSRALKRCSSQIEISDVRCSDLSNKSGKPPDAYLK